MFKLSPNPPLWREARAGLELAALLRDPVFRGEGVSDGRGQPVMLIPGFLAGDDSLRLMARWLKGTGHHPCRAGIRANVSCSGVAIDRLEARLEHLVERQGRRAAIVGHSRGGSFARVLAHRRPDLVSGFVLLGCPQTDPLAIHPLVRAQIETVATLGGLGLPGLFSRECLEGECCTPFWDEFFAPVPRGIRHVSVYSRTDGVVRWKACLDEHSELVEVRSSHCGMAWHPDVYRAVADSLAGFRRTDARRRPLSVGAEPARLRAVA
ncbi:MAG: alpha/beta hydrolase [Thermoleophilaceae bacterium]|nr:alpha/beta hydrolase [Thermoleophilaceae bacterium]